MLINTSRLKYLVKAVNNKTLMRRSSCAVEIVEGGLNART